MQNNINNETGVPPLTQSATPAAVDTGVLAPEVRKAETLPSATDNQTAGVNAAVDSTRAGASASAESSPPFGLPGVQPAQPLPPTESQASMQANRSAAKAETPAGGGYPPRLPPAVANANCPEEPKRREGIQPSPLDIEEFIREVQERKRGAKTMREIKSLGDYIRELVHRGVPLGPIYEGLKRRDLVSCSRSRFGEICAELFPDLFGPADRRNA